MTVPVKKSSCLLFLQHCYGKEIDISDLETVAEMMILAARFGEDNLLSLMQDKLQCAEIGDEDNLSPLYLLIRGGGQHAQVSPGLQLHNLIISSIFRNKSPSNTSH